jgi:hypothetical protein
VSSRSGAPVPSPTRRGDRWRADAHWFLTDPQNLEQLEQGGGGGSREHQMPTSHATTPQGGGSREEGGGAHRSFGGVSTGCVAPVGGSREVGVPELWRTGAGRWEYRSYGGPEQGGGSTGPRQPRARAPYREHRTRTGPRAPEEQRSHGGSQARRAGEERRRRARRGTPPPETETPRAGSGSRRTERRGRGSERALGLGLQRRRPRLRSG